LAGWVSATVGFARRSLGAMLLANTANLSCPTPAALSPSRVWLFRWCSSPGHTQVTPARCDHPEVADHGLLNAGFAMARRSASFVPSASDLPYIASAPFRSAWCS